MRILTAFCLICTHVALAVGIIHHYNKPNGVMSNAIVIVNDEADIHNVDMRGSIVVFNPYMIRGDISNNQLGKDHVFVGNEALNTINDLNKKLNEQSAFLHGKNIRKL